MFAGIVDNDDIKKYLVANKHQNDLFDIILETGNIINHKVYRKWAEILLNYCNKKPKEAGIEIVDCACNVHSFPCSFSV